MINKELKKLGKVLNIKESGDITFQGAALWNIAFAIWTEKNHPEMQDIPSRIHMEEEKRKRTKCT